MTQRTFTVILNTGSGSRSGNEMRDAVSYAMGQAGIAADIVDIGGQRDIDTAVMDAVRKAGGSGRIVVAAGGDGTINAVANACHALDVTMGIIPLGTFNYFARENGIALDVEGAIDVLKNGQEKIAAAGKVNDRLFLVNASFGLYTTIIRNREKVKKRFGRYRAVALISALSCLLRGRATFGVDIESHGKVLHRDTSMVFVGNNKTQLDSLGLATAETEGPDTVSMVLLKPVSRWQTARLLLRGLLRNMRSEERLEEFSASHITVQTQRTYIDAVVDGEIIRLKAPLDFAAVPNGVRLICPADKKAAP